MEILKLSFLASVFIVVIIIIRALALHKLPKRTFLALWAVALCRLLIPFSIPSHFSIYTLASMLKTNFSAIGKTAKNMTPTNIEMVAGLNTSLSKTISAGISPFTAIWLIGLSLCALFFLITHLRCRREYKSALPVNSEFVSAWQKSHPTRRKVEIKQSDKIAAPLTYGILQPVILLPKAMNCMSETQLQYVLIHEFVHIQRFDTLVKLTLAIAVCVHWFNPLVWAMYGLANRDIELSCDETVVKTFGENKKSAYALALIELEERKSHITPLISNFSKNAIEERIVSIMKIKKTSLSVIFIALALVIGTTIIFVTNKANTAGTDSNITGITESKANNPDKLKFWTIDDFEKWIKQEKCAIQKLADDGNNKYYDSKTNKWHTWTQQDVDQLNMQWQKQLECMKQGYQYTKDIKLSDGGLLAGYFEPNTGEVLSAGSAIITLSNGASVNLGTFDTAEKANIAVKHYLNEQVKTGKMTQQEADKTFKSSFKN